MAFTFTDNDSVLLADNAALTFPDADWAIGGWVKFSSRTGTVARNLFKWGSGYSSNTELRVGDASHASFPDDINIFFIDDDGTNISFSTGSNEFQSNTSWTHILVERTGTTIAIFKNGIQTGSGSNANLNALNAGASFKLGNNQYDNGDFLGDMAEWAKWNRALTSTEKANLSNATLAYSPNYYSSNLAWYMPMYSGDYTEKVVGIAVTNNGTTGATHPPVAYPLAAPLLTNTPAFFGATLATTGQSLTAPLLDNTPTFYGPTFAPGSVSLTAPLLTNSPTFPGPALAATYSVTAPLLTNTPAFYGPVLTATYALTAPLLTNTPSFYGPAFVPGSVSVAPPLLSNTPTFYGPTVTTTYSMTAPLLSNAPTFYGAALQHTGPQTVDMPLLSLSQTFYSPSIGYKWFDVNNVTAGEWTDVDHAFEEL